MNGKNNLKLAFMLIIIAYIFNIAVRFIYIGAVSDVNAFYWHNQLMINNVDGYYYLEGARDIIDGVKHTDYSNTTTPLAIFTAFLAKFFNVSVDSLGLYMPGIFGSLVVIPLVLIGRVLGNVWVGFLQGETDEKVVKF